jgi:hypothetical protein
MWTNSRIQVLWFFRPYKRSLKFHHHLLDTSRSEPLPRARVLGVELILADLLLLNEGSNPEYAHTVSIPQIVAQVELVQIERNDKGGEGWRRVWCSEERQGKVWTGREGQQDDYGLTMKTNRKTCLLPNLGAFRASEVAIVEEMKVVDAVNLGNSFDIRLEK